MDALTPAEINRYMGPYGDYHTPVGETYEYWKDELRSLGRTKNSPAFSSVLDTTTYAAGTYQIGWRHSYKTLAATAEHIRSLRERALSTPTLEAFARVLVPKLRDAYLRETLHLICRRAGLTEREARRRVTRGIAEGAIALPEAYAAMAQAVLDEP